VATVLVVDDNEPIRRLVARVLEREGHDVSQALDGMEAVSKIDADHYDAVVLDLMMPRADGFHVIKALRERHPELLRRVLVMTAAIAHISNDDLEGVGAVISKPFEIDTLMEGIAACLPSRE
jgi:DNA-binding response OmpR family regulator